MEYMITGLIAGLLSAFFCVLFYRKGVRDGMGVRDGVPPPGFKNPVKAVKDAVETGEEAKKVRQEETELIKELHSLMEYQPEFIKGRD